MKYIIDSASPKEIREAVELGAYGITANPSMYRNNRQAFLPFLESCSSMEPSFLTGEAMGSTLEEVEAEVRKVQEIDPGIIIKLNFSPNALKLCRRLKKRGIKTAVTGVPYAAIPYALYRKTLEHPLTDRGIRDFERDWKAAGQEGIDMP